MGKAEQEGSLEFAGVPQRVLEIFPIGLIGCLALEYNPAHTLLSIFKGPGK